MEQTFGGRLRGYRKGKHLTQQELAERIGVSDKTVSRWESGGGYPDVPVLVPLARALGVTVDDLLDDRRPIRTLTKADGQNLLSFAFALGGGALFFLLDLFMPGFLCYLAYLGCLAYGVYLQKYYSYQSRWFLLGEAVVNLGVNLSIALKSLAAALTGSMALGLSQSLDGNGQPITYLGGYSGPLSDIVWCCARHPALAGTAVVLLALALTALTQYWVWLKGFDGQIPGSLQTEEPPLRLTWGRPSVRQLLPGAVPLLAGLYWLPGLWKALGPQVPEAFHAPTRLFALWLLILALLAALPLLKKGFRRWIAPAWVMTGLCWGMTGLLRYESMWSDISRQLLPYREGSIRTGRYFAVPWGSQGTLVLALTLAALWIVLCCLHLRRAGSDEGLHGA